jgi:Skp family chaperone for outer membrane proteins
MNNIRFLQFGWVLAAALVGVLVAGGFGQSNDKIGVVDISRVVEGSDFGKQIQQEFNAMKEAREKVLEFVDTHRILTNEQAQRVRDLSLKPNPTKEDQAELDRIKAEVVATGKRSNELATKSTALTPEERTLLEDYARRSQIMNEVAQRWYREFSNDIQNWADGQKMASIERARAAVQEVARAQGYSVVFEVGIAPYGANDITGDALKAMNAKR